MSDQFSNPSKTVIFLAILLFPFILLGYLVLQLVKHLDRRSIKKSFRKLWNRDMNALEEMMLDIQLTEKYKV